MHLPRQEFPRSPIVGFLKGIELEVCHKLQGVGVVALTHRCRQRRGECTKQDALSDEVEGGAMRHEHVCTFLSCDVNVV